MCSMHRDTTASAMVRISSTEYSRFISASSASSACEVVSRQPILHLVIRADQRQEPRRPCVERNRRKRLLRQRDQRMGDALAAREPPDRVAEPCRQCNSVAAVPGGDVGAVETTG